MLVPMPELTGPEQHLELSRSVATLHAGAATAPEVSFLKHSGVSNTLLSLRKPGHLACPKRKCSAKPEMPNLGKRKKKKEILWE